MKIAIILIAAIIGVLGINWREKKRKTILIVILWCLSAGLMVWESNCEDKKCLDAELTGKNKNIRDSVLSSQRHNLLLSRLDSVSKVYKLDSLELVACKTMNNYYTKNLNNGINNGNIGDNGRIEHNRKNEENSFNNSGTNNGVQVAHNSGIITLEKRLSKEGESSLLDGLKKIREKYPKLSKRVVIAYTQDSEFLRDIEKTVQLNGYSIIAHGIATFDLAPVGFRINPIQMHLRSFQGTGSPDTTYHPIYIDVGLPF